MAAAVSLPFSIYSSDPQHNRTATPLFTCPSPILPTNHSLLSLHKSHHCHFKSLVSSSHSSSSSTSSTAAYSFLEDTFRTGRFLTNEELEKLKTLEKFVHFQELKSGFLWVRVMRPEEEMDATVNLLAESFAESMLLPVGYEKLLRFLVKQYLLERRAVMPHAVTLVGFYRGKEEEEGQSGGGGEQVELAATVEVCFDKRGANASPPTPTSPKNSPYICNMTVQKQFRRRGIGWHLLKASEEIISQMTSSKEVYLHCRIIDAAPFNMYTKAGYKIVKTDSILILLMLQRRKHLMCKNLPVLDSPSKSDIAGSDEELPP
ncbi:hypothetical protein ACOSQ2_018593 [Xanthoceras sorbifolium]|uniref:N-acetyltransferase domain-containing protein n=1 Tax=Xanthoceras sorbifolium TaxID=99658 RepID=A0ABQ8I194_9ROSI|nr:hypothetical protein JRO89_XS05G0074400 [Xanthoceras sorbifolium]